MTFKVKDHYFHKAKKDNFLARSVYKLEEIDERFKILKKNDQVIDFGYHPGSWVQYTSEKVGVNGLVIGADVRDINKKLLGVPNVRLFQRDILTIETMQELGVSDQFDVVLSDMAPNTTGIMSVDQARSLNLVEMVFFLMPKFLKPGGNTVIKVFESNDAQVFLKEQKKLFSEFHYLRPKSTRSVSKEYFVIGKDFRP
ncbi:RlmE family RNA methyltransferase [Bacteriovorax stolpii]|uniref:Ribosomal RNA large subunit methyltransferase E n=1 Tax=Bacteriovorax stolpii TaxID=960 RepID=A0A2K9NM82_BACTC|nr:RlmE family RNA methyltransferase [Bacteriovorax stolpii]AUN96620.1 50S rRNA methyltransferase [Bacteriovorax stolpii]QDK43448.1 RlmE family RNA methyltransferase [Bacteriovorax stolpii]TDP53859.1 23S rRNA Um-2552 2'-O-methyltransferase [Bacteriovorax stolpii]